MNIIKAAKALKEGKIVLHPRHQWLVHIDPRDKTVSYRFSGEPVAFSVDALLSEKWTVVDE